jgi:indolepyruvate ferredoxin oxidoreductase
MLKNVSLADKFDLAKDRAYLTGIEALVRLPLLQHQRDLDAGQCPARRP